jgi:cephalosporin hydroxylase
MLIWDVKPKTIIEIGSGSGASAIWMADLVKSYELETQIYSLDVEKPTVEHERVRFIHGDSNRIEQGFSSDMLAGLPHPWIVIEDAHVNVLQVVGHFSAHMTAGDYMILEDTRESKATTY